MDIQNNMDSQDNMEILNNMDIHNNMNIHDNLNILNNIVFHDNMDIRDNLDILNSLNIQNNMILLHQEGRMGESRKSLHRLSVRLGESSGDLKKIGISTNSMKRTQVKEVNVKNDYGKNLDGGTEV